MSVLWLYEYVMYNLDVNLGMKLWNIFENSTVSSEVASLYGLFWIEIPTLDFCMHLLMNLGSHWNADLGKA